jgi:hypothetical protein
MLDETGTISCPMVGFGVVEPLVLLPYGKSSLLPHFDLTAVSLLRAIFVGSYMPALHCLYSL